MLVTINLPEVSKLELSKVLIAGMPAVVKMLIESNDLIEKICVNSKFSWYYSKNVFKDNETIENSLKDIEWGLITSGTNIQMYVLSDECENRFIKVQCIPNDGERDGQMVECISKKIVLKKIQLNSLPMTKAHGQTKHKLNSNS